MKRLREWWRRRTWVPEPSVHIMVSRQTRLPLVECKAADFETAARWNRRKARNLAKEHMAKRTPRRAGRIRWNTQAAELLERIAGELSEDERFEDLPRRKRRRFGQELEAIGSGA